MTRTLLPLPDLDLDATLSCGQCFRWRRRADGVWLGVAMGQAAAARPVPGGVLLEHGGAAGQWEDYFDLKRDYAALRAEMASEPALARAVSFAPGLRVLRQEPWEALCTFILSQNNNIPRITGIVGRLCEAFGEPLAQQPDWGADELPPGGLRAFPGPGRLAALSVEALAPLRAGFRAAYLLDAARRVAAGEIDLAALHTMPLGEAEAALRCITGVGPKVAASALLYGCGRLECVPVDVWMRRALDAHFPGGIPARFAPFAGIAQQFLFHAERCGAQNPARKEEIRNAG